MVVGALALMTASFLGGWVAHRPPRALDTTTAEDRDRDGLADDRFVVIPAVGAAGGAPLPGFLEGVFGAAP